MGIYMHGARQNRAACNRVKRHRAHFLNSALERGFEHHCGHGESPSTTFQHHCGYRAVPSGHFERHGGNGASPRGNFNRHCGHRAARAAFSTAKWLLYNRYKSFQPRIFAKLLSSEACKLSEAHEENSIVDMCGFAFKGIFYFNSVVCMAFVSKLRTLIRS